MFNSLEIPKKLFGRGGGRHPLVGSLTTSSVHLPMFPAWVGHLSLSAVTTPDISQVYPESGGYLSVMIGKALFSPFHFEIR